MVLAIAIGSVTSCVSSKRERVTLKDDDKAECYYCSPSHNTVKTLFYVTVLKVPDTVLKVLRMFSLYIHTNKRRVQLLDFFFWYDAAKQHCS